MHGASRPIIGTMLEEGTFTHTLLDTKNHTTHDTSKFLKASAWAHSFYFLVFWKKMKKKEKLIQKHPHTFPFASKLWKWSSGSDWAHQRPPEARLPLPTIDLCTSGDLRPAKDDIYYAYFDGKCCCEIWPKTNKKNSLKKYINKSKKNEKKKKTLVDVCRRWISLLDVFFIVIWLMPPPVEHATIYRCYLCLSLCEYLFLLHSSSACMWAYTLVPMCDLAPYTFVHNVLIFWHLFLYSCIFVYMHFSLFTSHQKWNFHLLSRSTCWYIDVNCVLYFYCMDSDRGRIRGGTVGCAASLFQILILT